MNKRGITLIELLIVVVIVGILAAIGIPMYNSYMERARRVDAKTALEQLRAAEEMRRAERGRYAELWDEIQNTWGGPAATVGDYTITLVVNSAAGTFTATAGPKPGGRQAKDGWLSINQDGVKTSQFPDRWTK